MKTNILKNNRLLIVCIYAVAFILMTWSFSSQAAEPTNPTVTIKTSMGNIVVKLNSDKAPESTKNFLKYVNKGHYEKTLFHRVIKDFMIQGGGFTEDFKEKKTLPPIQNEAKNGLSNKRGTIAMARTNVVNSATSQFFINTVDNPRLDYKSDADYGYAVFGEVIEGMDVVDKIRNVKTTTLVEYENVPADPIIIKSVKLGKK